jgi:dynein light chain Tctex-type 1|eukprot:CAMPEP_0174292422 /NCGR_PEP_ID=MMETSP0809-20121228/35467_1 /TAXON_ID=73025 ORGANISM="Eutreptiella gymnastica-like, Strain CCMP1594" /NCGR_SAMPLE_ID=MMETSP0809 /ASSEMBLY_ACC=CAM_ASM_000658 /LENGTH=120 /DNA_ID=CAMNT_0015392499 /DNA_START=26 /DNA_END=388 /DNA_ORIENTATION=-
MSDQVNADNIDMAQVSMSFEEEVSALVQEAVKDVISPTSAYNHTKVGLWVNMICEGIMKKLMELKMPRKYIVNCTVLQRNGAGLHTATSCHWDTEGDGCYTHKVEFKTLICIATVYGLQL